jgi:hypothetical protein
MTALPLIVVILHGAVLAAPPTIKLDLRLPVQPKRSPSKPGSDQQLEELARKALPKDHERIEFVVVIRAVGSSDVFFNKKAVDLDIADESGYPLPTRCVHQRSLESPRSYVRRHSGDEVVVHLFTDPCWSTIPGKKYTIVAIFEDPGGIGENLGFQDSRPTAPDGATLVTRRIVSNKITMKWPPPEHLVAPR